MNVFRSSQVKEPLGDGPPRDGFAGFDAGLRRLAEGAQGSERVLVVHTRSAEEARAASFHAKRVFAAHGIRTIALEGERLIWSEAAAKLGVTPDYTTPLAFAEHLTRALGSHRTALLLPLPKKETWERELLVELLRSGTAIFVVFERGETTEEPLEHALVCNLSAPLDEADVRRWFDVVALDFLKRSGDDPPTLTEIDRLLHEPERDTDAAYEGLPEGARALYRALALTFPGWLKEDAERFATAFDGAGELHLTELFGGGMFSSQARWLATPSFDEAQPIELAGNAASSLAHSFPDAPLPLLRAAELYVLAKKVDEADRLHARAMQVLRHPTLRREFVSRWRAALEPLDRADRLKLYRSAAERALAVREAEEARGWAELATRIAGDQIDVTILLAQSLVSSGDFVAARAALERARMLPGATEYELLLSVERAEIALRDGDIDLAREEAEHAAAKRDEPALALRARNILGKALLAESKWEEADLHFAEDAIFAASTGESTGELRARLNRGVALLSRGLHDEARSVLEEVERDGQTLCNPAACAYAAENLAVIAMWAHDYGRALAYSERALDQMIQAGDRVTVSLVLANLAELRCKLGLFAHAEHALAFGKQVIGPGMPPTVSARLGITGARLALIRGHTAEAAREIQRVISQPRSEISAQAYLVATRIALEDGNLVRAKDHLACAHEVASADKVRAEAALLSAYLTRAEGLPYLELAEQALAQALEAGEEELLREVHMLLFDQYRAANQLDLARAQLVQAEELRDRVASQLEGDVRRAYFERVDVALIASLRQDMDASLPAAVDSSAPPPIRAAASPARKSTARREIVGQDPSIRALLHAIQRVAKADNSVLIHGESGTGKELVAEAIHRASPRHGGPLVSVNCAALVESLLLSELFGHEKGSFTGAGGRRRGRFEVADGGTLFLDEIGDISPRTQVALLRVLQERTFERVGGTTPVKVDVRIVCATHRDLRAMVERGQFREDLYYRLRGVTLEVPPLRQRLGDLPLLCESLIERIADEQGSPRKAMSPSAIDLLARHKWPGNIRELENVLRVAFLFADGSVLTVKDFTSNVDELRTLASASMPPPRPSQGVSVDDDPTPNDPPEGPLPPQESDATSVVYDCLRGGQTSLADIKRQIERDCIARALAETKGNITRAAALLGMKRPRLSQLVKQYGLGTATEDV